MGEIEGTYRVLQTAGTRLGAQTPVGVSTLEPGQMFSPRMQEKHMHVRVKLLDNTVEIFDIEPKCDGQVLLAQVWKHLNLIECDYFGLEFQNIQSYWIWLEPMKPIIRQIRRPKNAMLRLAVKFFPPDPGQLQEEYTRYLFALQLKRDLLEERLTCAATTAALLTSHLLQAEIGDYDETLDREHLKATVYLPSQEQALEKILAFHRRHVGQTPAESDFQVLEIARKLEMYGIRFHTASDREGTKINLAVSHMGVLVFQGTTKINTFNWSKVRKLSFKRKRFLIKLHPEVHGPYQDTLEFLLGSRDECKNFWKICVEYHTFFRLLDQPKPKAKAVFFSRGSSFRYSGRTQKQLVDYIKDGGMKRIPYERWHGKTQTSVRALTADLPKQSISFTEGLRSSASLSSANASFYPLAPSPVSPPGRPDFKDSSSSLADPLAPCISSAAVKNMATRRSSGAAEGPGTPLAQPPGSPALQSGPGVGFCPVVSSRGSVCPTGQSLSALDLDVGRAGRVLRAASGNDIGEDDILPDLFLSSGEYGCGRQRHGGGAVFTLTNAQLQVSEEFIDDDPADISFFAGGSEAFSFPYSPLAPPGPRALAQPIASPAWSGPESAQSSPDRYSTEAVDMNVEDEFEFGEGSDFNGNAHPSDTSELFEVKAQASLMQSLLSPSDTSSLRNNQSENSSLHNMPLHGGLSLHTSSSANQSEASSMVNFPAYSIRSESSSAFQFSDIIDQLEQLSYPPTTAEDSSSTDSSSWGSETEAPLDMSLFFSNPFTQTGGERVPFDFQNNLKNLTPGDQKGKNSS
uniref:FERM, ARH/RhoGEF and pleckstrin domain protein 2 n=1 Tax=Chinchilla lanigera TaxID=34839 RepID=A0A8C2YJD7_CHILA